MQHWYVARTQSKGERLALGHLMRQGFDAYMPQFLKRRRHARKTDWVASPLFPGYVFVRFDVEKARWRAIHSTIGVRQLVCFGETPAPVAPEVVDEIRAREDDSGMVVMGVEQAFRRGESVRVLDGPFSDLVGLFDCTVAADRVRILLDLLGRQVRVKVPLDAVCAC